jgi:hypothetical protein
MAGGVGAGLAIALDPEMTMVSSGGGIIWEAATVLSKFLAEEDWDGWEQLAAAAAREGGGVLRLLELGSGTGALGLLAHTTCRRRLPGVEVQTVLTDSHTTDLMELNIRSNAAALCPTDATVGLPEARHLGWEQLTCSTSDSDSDSGSGDSSCDWSGCWDLVLGSDITYDEESWPALLECLRHLCSSAVRARDGAQPSPHHTRVLLAHTHRDMPCDMRCGQSPSDGQGSAVCDDGPNLLARLTEAGKPSGGDSPARRDRGVHWTVSVLKMAQTGTDPMDVWSSKHTVSVIELRACSSLHE